MSMSPVQPQGAPNAMQAAKGPDVQAHAGDTLAERLTAQRRDSLRSAESARERHRADFERALRRAGAEDDTPRVRTADDESATPANGSMIVTAASVARPQSTHELGRADAVDGIDRARQHETASQRPAGAALAAPLDLLGRPAAMPASPPSPHAAMPSLPAIAPAADAADRWRFELADTSLPIRQLELQRVPHGALEVSLPTLDTPSALTAPLARLRERLLERGATLSALELPAAKHDDDDDGVQSPLEPRRWPDGARP